MGSHTKTTIDVCPFWSAASKKCHACTDGLFIPLDEHISTYCASKDHHHCLQYSLFTSTNRQAADESRNIVKNRRQTLRIQLSEHIQLVKMIQAGKIIKQFSEKATTLDMSKVGMRLQTNVPLVNDTVIQFAFNNNFPTTLRTGAGLVEWCNKQIDTPGYQAGVSFQSRWILEAMDIFLKSHIVRD